MSAETILQEILDRIDNYIDLWADREFLMAQTTHVEIGTQATLILQNAGRSRMLLEIYNTDAAQPVWVSPGKTRRPAGIPIFAESSEKVAVPPGQDLYGIVEGGTVDIRFTEYNIPG